MNNILYTLSSITESELDDLIIKRLGHNITDERIRDGIIDLIAEKILDCLDDFADSAIDTMMIGVENQWQTN